jgi:ADP-heptose:LPS heptosyltransferase
MSGDVIAIRLRQLGDVLATLDALKALKEADPHRRVVFVVDAHYHGLLGNESYIDELVDAPPRVGGPRGLSRYVSYVRRIRARRAAVILDFHGSARTALLSLVSGARSRVGFDVKVRKAAYQVVEPRADRENSRWLRRHSASSALRLARHAGVGDRRTAGMVAVNIGEAAIRRGRDLMEEVGVTPEEIDCGRLVGLNPGKPYPAKAWPSERFAALARARVEAGDRVVVLWGPGEEELAWEVSRMAGGGVTPAPRVALSELPGFVRQLRLLVTIDSGLKHLAVCAGVPTVTIFGSTDPREWHIGGASDRYVWRGYSCSPCRRLECPFGAPCMGDVTVEDVSRVVDDIDGKGGVRL